MQVLVTIQPEGRPRFRELVTATDTFAAVEAVLGIHNTGPAAYIAARPATREDIEQYSVPSMQAQLLDEYRTGLDSVE